ncbi:nuclear transport factor 2 family protein [Amycolatopsis sp. GM8]|uniref:nuclear transport factor 2 family protein n=1 Tax=Amycolatopsis sp. GM8 TaxID=2896530 RepID=UPI001F378D97|nr:nuclear transport factor 2 family protein [Amycolatopsis sp. GM8]
MTDVPAPVQRILDAIDAGDTAAFVRAFDADGVVDDWGREFRGHDRIRAWSDKEFIGVQVSFSDLTVAEPGNPVTIRVQVGGNGFNGPSGFTFDVRGDHVHRMTITA